MAWHKKLILIYSMLIPLSSLYAQSWADRELVDYVARFEQYYHFYHGGDVQKGNWEIAFGDVNKVLGSSSTEPCAEDNVSGLFSHLFSRTPWCDQINAVCSRRADGSRSIVVNEGRWKEISKLAKEQIIFHECGHCFMNREHREDRTPAGTEKSIMAHAQLNDEQYEKYRPKYLLELFLNQDWKE